MDRELEDFIKNAKDDLYYKLPWFNLSVSGKKLKELWIKEQKNTKNGRNVKMLNPKD
jgi:hypothetical protein